jgi:hypothetical protein
LEEEAAKLKLQNESLVAAMSEKNDSIEMLQAQLTEESMKKDDSKQLLIQLQSTIQLLESRLAEQRSDEQKKAKEFEKLKKKVQETEESIQLYKEQSDVYQRESRRLAKELSKIEDSIMCVICNENVADLLVFPCRHLSTCASCAQFHAKTMTK